LAVGYGDITENVLLALTKTQGIAVFRKSL